MWEAGAGGGGEGRGAERERVNNCILIFMSTAQLPHDTQRRG